jgi:hypothetical protein
VRLCGFYSVDSARAYCRVFEDDGCCQSSQVNGNVTDIIQLLPVTAGSEKAEVADESIWSTGIIIGVAFAAFVGILSIILIAVLVRKRSKSSTSRTRRVKPAKARKAEKPKNKSIWVKMRENRENRKHVGDDWEGDSFRESHFDKPVPAASMIDGGGDGQQVDETMQVLYNYVPNLQDEIYLYVGDPVIVKAKFDDGWYAFHFNCC